MTEEKKTTPMQEEPVTEQENVAVKPSVKWDDTKMQTTYANVVNVSSTREEVSVFFDILRSSQFRKKARNIGGHDTRDSGKTIYNNKK